MLGAQKNALRNFLHQKKHTIASYRITESFKCLQKLAV